MQKSSTADASTIGEVVVNPDGSNIGNSPGTAATSLGKAEDAVHASGDTGVFMLAVRNDSNTSRTSANTDYSPVSVDSAGNLTSVGNIAHDTADAGNPFKLGHKATTSISALTLVANSDRTDSFAGVDGVQIVRPHSNLEDLVSGTASNTDGNSTALIAAQGASIKACLTDVTVVNTSVTNIYVELKDGATVKWVIGVAANATETVQFASPLRGTANTAWNFDPSVPAITVYCSASAFRSRV